ncbi:MAG: DNA polymerase III subunit delta [Candidatus Komeilibacteria bacterium]|nr:DNA polymerase III subunit delta [Candidatus Komeilibacteria bacterium]
MFIFLYGEDSYRSTQKLQEIKESFIKKTDPSGLNIIVFEGDDFNLEKFNSAAAQGGFLVSKRLIIVKNLLSGKVKKDLAEQLLELLERLKKSDNLFVFWEDGKADKRTILFKTLSADKKYTQEFEPLEPIPLTAWLKNYLNNNQGKISPAALQLLLAYLGNNLWQITGELDKLIAYKNGGEISETDVKTFVAAKINENIFALTDAVAGGNKALAVKLLQEQLAGGLNEIYLLTMLTRQFRLIAQMMPLAAAGQSESAIARLTKLHPFVVKKTLLLTKKFTLEKLKNIYGRLIKLDGQFKSTGLPPQTLLDLFILEI